MLDQPATGQALWALYDSTQCIRPEYALTVFWSESAFNPAAVNSIGCTGLNQSCPFAFTLPSGYATWAASQQITNFIAAQFKALVAKFGPINSGTKLYIGNFWPAALSYVKNLDSPVVSSPAVLKANPGIDRAGKGYISAGDMAFLISRAARNVNVQQAIRSAYALRPSETPRDPVLGTDFGVLHPLLRPLLIGGSLAVGGIAAAHLFLDLPLPFLSKRR